MRSIGRVGPALLLGVALSILGPLGDGASASSPPASGGHDKACTDGAERGCALFAGACTVGRQQCRGGEWGSCAFDAPSETPCVTRCAGGHLSGESLFANVNRVEALRSDWVPADLVIVPAGYRRGDTSRMRLPALGPMLRMLRELRKEGLPPVFCGSPYRSFPEQCALFAGYAAQQGCDRANLSSAMAGHSEHQLGTACDLVSTEDFLLRESSPSAAWLHAHAHEYGFVESYPEGTHAVTGYKTEPWHLRYLGLRAAALHAQVERALGHALSTPEFVASIACWPEAQLAALASEDADEERAAGEAVCSEYRGLSICQSASTLVDCSSGAAKLVGCPHRCVTRARGVSDVCN